MKHSKESNMLFIFLVFTAIILIGSLIKHLSKDEPFDEAIAVVYTNDYSLANTKKFLIEVSKLEDTVYEPNKLGYFTDKPVMSTKDGIVYFENGKKLFLKDMIFEYYNVVVSDSQIYTMWNQNEYLKFKGIQDLSQTEIGLFKNLIININPELMNDGNHVTDNSNPPNSK